SLLGGRLRRHFCRCARLWCDVVSRLGRREIHQEGQVTRLVLALAALVSFAAPAAGEQGLYLLVPPINDASLPLPLADASAPLARWRALGTYGDLAECQADQDARFRTASKATKEAEAEAKAVQMWLLAMQIQIHNARCISVNDPRLAH